MTTIYDELRNSLQMNPRTWLVTGVGGFIGSHLLEQLLTLGQEVRGIDNFSTGNVENLRCVRAIVGERAWRGFSFLRGTITSPHDCALACKGVDLVLHQAALGSVPRSLKDPPATHAANVDGFFNLLSAANEAGVQRFVYASSSSVYGDHPTLPKQEHLIGRPLSPYALSKSINEQYADVFARCFGLPCVGLRYFNVFGPRQEANGEYPAVTPKWIHKILAGEPCEIYGEHTNSRDFTYVANAVQANLLASHSPMHSSKHLVFNVASGKRTNLLELHQHLCQQLSAIGVEVAHSTPVMSQSRKGDVSHSHADLTRTMEGLGYSPCPFEDGISETARWYFERWQQFVDSSMPESTF